MTLRIETLTGAAAQAAMPALARLRRSVFRAWPYLYEGDDGTEQEHAGAYQRSARFAVVLAHDGAAAVGAATCLPLADEDAAIRAPFLRHGIDPARVFYFGESVLLPAYRGAGAGVAFFTHREAHARACGADYAAFCAVRRAEDDPRRPADAVPLDGFWRRRGYTPYPHLVCHMRWREIGQHQETENALSFWMKSLSGAPLP